MNNSAIENERALETLWDEFLERWPIEKLAQITLSDYTRQGTDDSFCYWLESRTETLGSLWGGSSFKFGVYARKDKAHKENGRGRCYNQQYGWMSKYGDTPEQAFIKVRTEIVKVARAARAGELSTVKSADLGEVTSWKIAFLYQNREKPILLPIFKVAMLKALTKQDQIDPILAHRQLLAKQGSRMFFEFAAALWQEADQLLAQELTTEQAQAYFEESPDYQAIKPPTQYVAGYESISGKQLALVRQNKKVTLFFSAGSWVNRIKHRASAVKEYAPEDSRNSNLGPNAPDLAVGNAVVSLVVETLAALEDICAAYEEESNTPVLQGINTQTEEAPMSFPLNQILYGPPGTGKTYATAELAVKIAEPVRYQTLVQNTEGDERRKAVKGLYDELVAGNRVAFATFHQSFSYEDFIEGIRAKTADDGKGLIYDVGDGVFKTIALRAEKAVPGETRLGLSDAPNIWKISIGRKKDKELRQRCLNSGEARIGWNSTGDLSIELDERTPTQKDYWNSLSSHNHSAINGFADEVQVGDVLLCLKDAETVQAIGVVESDYFFDESAGENDEYKYAHARKVKWLLKDINLNILPLNSGRRMVQQTFYPLGRISWNTLIAEIHKQGIDLPELAADEASTGPTPDFVMIIDEINRGNIARVFGELITLLEPDKRKGGADERSVILPYSKEPFTVPSNLYVIGTMNTADKSLAQLDLALRRRFEFVEVMPNADLLEGIEVHGISIKTLLQVINARIEVLLDRDHLIGHSYFLPLKQDGIDHEALLASIFVNKIIPLLQEYFFSDWEKIGWVLNDIDKPWECRFVQMLGDREPLASLFSNKVTEQLQDRRYQINAGAFRNPEAYRGILIKRDQQVGSDSEA